MSCHTKEELENMLEGVINALDLSDSMIEKHGPLGTPPAEIVKEVLKRKDLQIRMLKKGFADAATGGWISSEDRLPALGEYVLVSNTIEYSIMRRVVSQPHESYFPWYWENTDIRVTDISEVSHWMPLPTLPGSRCFDE